MSKLIEEWRDIPQTNGLYQGSDWGRIKNTKSEKILSPYKCTNGHLQIRIRRKQCMVHKIIAQLFIPNPNNYDVVHHIDHNPENNHIENLLWLSKKEHDKLHHEERQMQVYQYTIKGKLVNIWESAVKAAKELEYCQSHINECCNSKLEKYKGYIWSYVPL
jgi:hypothetical protein